MANIQVVEVKVGSINTNRNSLVPTYLRYLTKMWFKNRLLFKEWQSNDGKKFLTTYLILHSLNHTRSHQLCWGDWEMGTAISCTECSLIHKIGSSSKESSLHVAVLFAK